MQGTEDKNARLVRSDNKAVITCTCFDCQPFCACMFNVEILVQSEMKKKTIWQYVSISRKEKEMHKSIVVISKKKSLISLTMIRKKCCRPVIFWQIKVKMHSTCFFDFRKENFKYTDLLHYYYMVVLNDK